MDISVVIPVKNEAENIPPLVREIRAALDGFIGYEIVFIDDGSNDATASEISRLAASHAELWTKRGDSHRRQGGARRLDCNTGRGRPERSRRYPEIVVSQPCGFRSCARSGQWKSRKTAG